MDEELPRPDASAGGTTEARPDAPSRPALPELPEAIAANADEVRRLVEAGAKSPEELSALAAKIRQHRELEESVWRAEVKPALLQAKKGRFSLRDLNAKDASQPKSSNGLQLGLAVFGAVALLLLMATRSSVLWILLPVVGVLYYAYRQGRHAHDAADEPPAVESPPA